MQNVNSLSVPNVNSLCTFIMWMNSVLAVWFTIPMNARFSLSWFNQSRHFCLVNISLLFFFIWDPIVWITPEADSGTTTQPKQPSLAKFSQPENHFGLAKEKLKDTRVMLTGCHLYGYKTEWCNGTIMSFWCTEVEECTKGMSNIFITLFLDPHLNNSLLFHHKSPHSHAIYESEQVLITIRNTTSITVSYCWKCSSNNKYFF